MLRITSMTMARHCRISQKNLALFNVSEQKVYSTNEAFLKPTEQQPVALENVFEFPSHHWASTPVYVGILKAENLDDTLAFAEKFPLNPDQACTLIHQVNKYLNGLKIDDILQDSRFEQAVNIVLNADLLERKNCYTLLITFRSMLISGLPIEHQISEKFRQLIETGLKVNAHPPNMAFSYFVCFYSDYDAKFSPDTKTNFQLLLEEHLTQRIDNRYNFKILLLILNKLCCKHRRYDNKLLQKVSSALMECLKQMPANELALTVEYLAAAQSRYVPLLSRLVAKLIAGSSQLTLEKKINVLACLIQLNYYSVQYLAPLLDSINQQVPSMTKAKLFNTCCLQLSKGRIRSPMTFILLIDWLDANYEQCSIDCLISFVSTLARCNFSISHVENEHLEKLQRIFDNICRDIVEDQVNDSKFLWLKYVWSMTILNQLTPDLASSVLNPEYFARVLEYEKNSSIHRIRLLNIYSSVRHDLKQSDIEQISNPCKYPGFLDNLQLSQNERKAKAAEECLNSLYLLAPKDTYCKQNLLMPEGYTIDAEMCIDEFGKAVPVKDWTKNVGVQKTAVILRDYHDETVISVMPTGHNALAERHLEKMGYRVIKVSTSSLLTKTNVLLRVANLKSEMLDKNLNHNV